MPWKETTTMEQKVEFINEWLSNQYTITELCKAFGISRPTAYRLIKRYEEFGLDGLLEQSRSPINHPNKTSEEIEKAIKLVVHYAIGISPESLIIETAKIFGFKHITEKIKLVISMIYEQMLSSGKIRFKKNIVTLSP